MKRMNAKRTVSLLVALCMMIALLPAIPVSASGGTNTEKYVFTSTALGLSSTLHFESYVNPGEYYAGFDTGVSKSKWAWVGQRGMSGAAYASTGFSSFTLKQAQAADAIANTAAIAFKINVTEPGTYSPSFNCRVRQIQYGIVSDLYFVPADFEGYANIDLTTADGLAAAIKAAPAGSKACVFATDSDTNSNGKVYTGDNTVALEAKDYYVIFHITDTVAATAVDDPAYVALNILDMTLTETDASMKLTASKDTIEVGGKATLTAEFEGLAQGAAAPSVTYEYDEDIVSVVNGVVTALEVGTATIKAKAQINGVSVSDTVTINVTPSKTDNVEKYVFTSTALGLSSTLHFESYVNPGEYYAGFDTGVSKSKWAWVGQRGMSGAAYASTGFSSFTLKQAQAADAIANTAAIAFKINVTDPGIYIPSFTCRIRQINYGIVSDLYFVPADFEGYANIDLTTADGLAAAIKAAPAGSKACVFATDSDTNNNGKVYNCDGSIALEAKDYYVILHITDTVAATAVDEPAYVALNVLDMTLTETAVALDVSVGSEKLIVGATTDITTSFEGLTQGEAAPSVTYEYDENIISVANGKITALATGTTTLKAKAQMKGMTVSDSVTITVTPPITDNVETYVFKSSALGVSGTLQYSAYANPGKYYDSFDTGVSKSKWAWVGQRNISYNAYATAALSAFTIKYADAPAAIADTAVMAFKINVTDPGLYIPSFTCQTRQWMYGYESDVYLVPADYAGYANIDLTTADGLAAAIKAAPADRKACTLITDGSANANKKFDGFSPISLEAKDYYLIFHIRNTTDSVSGDGEKPPYAGLSLMDMTLTETEVTLDLTVTEKELEVGQTAELSAKVAGMGGNAPSVAYEYDNSIISVANGVITALSVGSTTLKATVSVGGKELSDSVNITVLPKDEGNAGVSVEYIFKTTALSAETVEKATVTAENKVNGLYGGVLRNVEFLRTYDAIDASLGQWMLAPMSSASFNMAANQINFDIKTTDYGKALPTSALIFKLKVPNKGDYKLAINANRHASGAGADIYFVNAADYPNLSRDDISKMTSVGYFDTRGSGETGYLEIGTVTAKKRGEYYLVFDMNSDNPNTTSGKHYLYLRNVKLFEALPTVEMSVDADIIEVGEEYVLNTVVKDAYGKEIENAEVSYSIEPAGIVAVENGKIKVLAEGEATITATYADKTKGTFRVEANDLKKPIPEIKYLFNYSVIKNATGRIPYADFPKVAKFGEYPDLDLTKTAPWTFCGTRGAYGGYIDATNMDVTIPEAPIDGDAPLYEQGKEGTVNSGFVMKLKVGQTGLYTPKLDWDEIAYGYQVEMYLVSTTVGGEFGADRLVAVNSNNDRGAGIGNALRILNPKSEYYIGSVKMGPTEDLPTYKNIFLREGEYFLIVKAVSGPDSLESTGGNYYSLFKSLTLSQASDNIVVGGTKKLGVGDSGSVSAKAYNLRGEEISGVDITFESSDESILTVDAQTGEITGIKEGKAEVIATAEIEGKAVKATYAVSVYSVSFEGVKTEDVTIEFADEDKTAQLVPVGYLTNGEEISLEGAYIEYRAKTPDIVSVDKSGVVTALRAGEGVVSVVVIKDGITKTCDAKITVTDNSRIASVSVSGAATVGYLRDSQLTLTVNFEDGRSLDVNGAIEKFYPGATVEWKIYETSTAGAVSIDENGVVFGEIPGATAKLGAVLKMGGQSVETAEGFEITVEASSDSDPRSFGYDFAASKETLIKLIDIEVDGWEPDTVASSKTARFQLFSFGLFAQTNAPGQKVVIHAKVPYSGLYDVSISGRANGVDGAERISVYADGRYIGEFSLQLNGKTREVPAKSLSAYYLDAGNHTFEFVLLPNEREAVTYTQIFRTLYFDAEPQSFDMTGIITEEDAFCLIVGESANPHARMATAESFVYAWEETDDELLDVSYEVTASSADDGSGAAVVSVDAKGNISALANGTAEVTIKAERKDRSESFEKVISITVADIIGELENERNTYYTGEAVDMVLSYKKADGSAVATKPSVEWESSDENLISFNGAELRATAAGRTTIKAKDSTTGKTLYENTVDVLEDYYGVVEISADPSLTLRPESNAKLSAKAMTMAGKAVDMQGAEVVWNVSEEFADKISVTSEGLLTAKAEGSAYVTASVTLANGEEAVGSAEVYVRKGKVSRTYYTEEKVNAARENIKKYSWARAEADVAIAEAEKYLKYSMEDLWDMIPGEGIPRSMSVGLKGDTDRIYCRYCGENISLITNIYPYITDPLNNPWKVQCPKCKRFFPSNDFASFYKLGLDPETGLFNRELALEKHLEMFGGTYGYGYLKNDLYPELRKTGLDPRTGDPITHGWGELPKEPENIADVWGVDDGYGYETGRMATPTLREVHTYIWFYNHFGLWYQSGKNCAAEVYNAITKLATAYIYTGDERYGKLGAVMLDRLADLYPDFNPNGSLPFGGDWGNTKYGKIITANWEAQRNKNYIYAYDALFPMYENEDVQKFLRRKAEQYPSIGDKSDANAIRENIENNFVYNQYVAATEYQLYGNFGFHQSTVAAAGVVLDRADQTPEILDWVFRTGKLTQVPPSLTGADVYTTLVDLVTRDGFGNESPAYNRIWFQDLEELANMLSDYENNGGYSLWDNPKYIEMAKAWNKFILLGRGVPSIGDSSGAGDFSIFPDDATFLPNAFKYTREKEETKQSAIEIAQLLYQNAMAKNGNLDNIHYDIFTKNPETIKSEVLDIIDTYGEYDYNKSSIMTGYGFAALRDGKFYDTIGADEIKDTTRDFWMYFGGQMSHSHGDMLNLGVQAYGVDLAPENGYPEGTSTAPSREQWTNTTIAHNAVTVNEKIQLKPSESGEPLHFDAKDTRVKVMDVDVPEVYDETDEYRRTVVMIDYDSEVSYGVDFFKILGGDDHLYSFHAASEEIGGYSDNLDIYVQPSGSYAGVDVPFGNDPWTVTTNVYQRLKYPRGYTWLFDVRRADNPDIAVNEPFYVDFEILDFNRHTRNSAKMDINLRLTMVNDFAPDEVTFAKGYPPRDKANLDKIKYFEHMLVRRKGNGLNTLFTTVIEPYNRERYISNISRVEMIPDGDTGTDKYAAVKVELCDGRIDYVMYAQDNSKTYTVRDGDYEFTFRGFVGVWTVDAEKNKLYSYINDGDTIGDITEATPSVNGYITGYNTEISFDNYIDVEFDSPIEDAELICDRIINVYHDGPGNSTFFIEGVELADDGMSARLDLGGVTVVGGYVDKFDFSQGYDYDVAENDRFKIPMSSEEDLAPIFDAVSDSLASKAGDSMTIDVNASSPVGSEVTYAERTLPRGASFNEETGTVTWKPTSSQTGENLIGIDAVDESGRISTLYFTVMVYGSTTGAGSQTPSTPSTPSEPSTPSTPGTSGGGAGGAGGGGGAAPAPSTPSDDKNDETSSVGDADSSLGEGAEKVRFVDLGAHAWAADAINALADEGIIKGTSENTFSPAANITRADFALLLVRAFKLESENKENFADVAASDYFAAELAIARNTGIVNGIGDNKYAPRNTITRQDMMTIVYRAMEQINKKPSPVGEGGPLSTDEAFADFASVADYAKEAVSALISAELVNGKSGQIAPTDYTTRAEVAVLIKRILDYTSK
ncbi:MAG: S-layer homology domain-containing protein [Oscillospiraceae bacterium]|nr:S-layer homology domain-containing protein [Oscillospiraceae bacterium]